MERTLFSAVPESQDRIQQDVPSYLNASHFETLQWLHRTSHYHAGVNGFPKSMILVSSESRRPSLRFTGRVHRILHSCNKNNPGYVPIRIRHYVGSWEVYTSRLDTRVGPIRNLQVYSYRAQLGRNQVDDAVRGWIRGFARLMQDNATRIQHLLQGTGQVQVSSALQTKIQQTNWSLTCRQIQSQIQKKLKEGSTLCPMVEATVSRARPPGSQVMADSRPIKGQSFKDTTHAKQLQWILRPFDDTTATR